MIDNEKIPVISGNVVSDEDYFTIKLYYEISTFEY